jgi:hypothetical protein
MLPHCSPLRRYSSVRRAADIETSRKEELVHDKEDAKAQRDHASKPMGPKTISPSRPVTQRQGRRLDLIALQTSAGNRVVAQLIREIRASSCPGSSPVMQRSEKNPGAIRSSVSFIDQTWRIFDQTTAKIKDIIYDEYIPLLVKHSKMSGHSGKPQGFVTPKKKGRGKNQKTGTTSPASSGASAPVAPIDRKTYPLPAAVTRKPDEQPPPFVLDKEKPYAIAAATGLVAWTKEATEAARRKFAELTLAIEKNKGVNIRWRLGARNVEDPDVLTAAGMKLASMEIKRPSSADHLRIDRTIRAARYQIVTRSEVVFFIKPPRGGPADATPIPQPGTKPLPVNERTVRIEITNSANPWPFTPTDPRGKSIRFQDENTLVKAARNRGLWPQNKQGETPPIPPGQNHLIPPGQNHHIVVEWTWCKEMGYGEKRIQFVVTPDEECSKTPGMKTKEKNQQYHSQFAAGKPQPARAVKKPPPWKGK